MKGLLIRTKLGLVSDNTWKQKNTEKIKATKLNKKAQLKNIKFVVECLYWPVYKLIVVVYNIKKGKSRNFYNSLE